MQQKKRTKRKHFSMAHYLAKPTHYIYYFFRFITCGKFHCNYPGKIYKIATTIRKYKLTGLNKLWPQKIQIMIF